MDSSSYTITAGQTVSFTARLLGNNGTPTGSIRFKANSVDIGGCTSISLSSGTAICSTSSLAAGTYQITGVYSGDATYSTAQAGPITQTVNPGAVTASLKIDSNRYSSKPGQPVNFTVTATGSSTPTGTVSFRDGTNVIAGCGAIPLSSGVAKCSTKALGSGSHQIRGYYSGDARNSAGIAGPITQTVG
jgi:hypothetical protein